MVEREYTPRGQGNYNTVAGSLGIASFLGLGANGNGGLFGNNSNCNNGTSYNNNGCCSENTPVSRYELEMALSSAAKDSKIALLEANIFTDSKINELGNRTLASFNEIRNELREVAVYQGINTATISCLRGQVQALQGEFNGLTKVVIPSTNVCESNYPVQVINTPCNPVFTSTVVAPAVQ